MHPDLQYLQCKELEIVTASGDMEVWKVQADNVRLQTASGDVTAQVQCRNLHANSVSGDVEICESYCAEAEIQSVSGDVTAKLWSEESIKAGTTSGDVELQLGILSKTVKVSSVSGDCSLQVPREQGFSLQYKTTSGDFSAGNMNFSGIMKGKSGNLTYLDGGNSSVTMSSISGDMEIYA